MMERIQHDSYAFCPNSKMRSEILQKKKLKVVNNKGRVKKQPKKPVKKKQRSRSPCPFKSSASMKEQVGTAIVAAFLTVTVTVTVSEYVLVLHRAHRLVVNVQPRLTAATAITPNNLNTTGTATEVRVKHVKGVVPPPAETSWW